MSNNLMAEEMDSRKSRVGPWLNKEELYNVYKLIYSPQADRNSKEKACDILKMWTIRRQNLTPASILSTLAILEVQIKDNDEKNQRNTSNELRTIYSNAFTRFLNYMSSIMLNRNFKSMYATAKELGIESFLVDLRHLCAHSHVLPALDVFQRSADYCMHWLRNFYWEREIKTVRDVAAQDVRLKNIVEFEESIESLLNVYDVATEAMHKNCKFSTDADGILSIENLSILNDYAVKLGKTKLAMIAPMTINELTTLACTNTSIRGNAKLYCGLIFKCKYFIESTAKIALNISYENTSKDKSQLISLHQNLFRSLAICGFIDSCFDLLMEICENDHECVERRLAASFWANQIVIGFQIFQEFKTICKAKKEKNPRFEMDLESINTEIMTKDIRAIYKDLGVNCSGVLLFGDTIRRPWFISFTRNYIQDRLSNINEYTAKTIEKCLVLTDPPFSVQHRNEILNLIQIYLGKSSEKASKAADNNSYYTLDDLYRKIGETKQTTLLTDTGHKKYGIWMEDSSNINWQTIPIGRPM